MISGSRIRQFWILGGVFLSASSIADDSTDLNAVMLGMADIRQSRASYIEEKNMNMLEIPLETRGILEYIAPDTIIREVQSPFTARYEIKGNLVTLHQRGKARKLDLDKLPLLRAFIESLRATLAGDLNLLQKFYNVEFTGVADQWKLNLSPVEAGMREFVDSIVLEGRFNHIHLLRIKDGNGDTTIMRLQPIPMGGHDG